MIITINKYATTCDDCGKFFNASYILKTKHKEQRIHLCKTCMNKLISGQLEKGYNMKDKESDKIRKALYDIGFTDINIEVCTNKKTGKKFKVVSYKDTGGNEKQANYTGYKNISDFVKDIAGR